jgi:hypothetical protein
LVFDECSSSVFRLAPDRYGNYINGKWSSLASLPSGYAPLYFASAVLPDGKLMVIGGEYIFCSGAESTLGAIYDPVANTWNSVTAPSGSGWTKIGDAQSVVLDNGTFMLGNCCSNQQALLNEKSMTWTIVGKGKEDPNSEEGWTLLKNGTVLEVNLSDTPYAQDYNPMSKKWESAGKLPVNIVSGYEIGPQTLRPDGTVFVAGANGDTVTYNSSTHRWKQGPTFPVGVSPFQQLDVADGPSALLTDGTVMISASPQLYLTPAYFFIFDGKKLTAMPPPPNSGNDSSYNIRLLMLPTGQVMEVDGSSDMEIFTGSGKANRQFAPVISSVPKSLSSGSTYQVVGRRLNGVSQNNMYGDDVQQATNYPLVRISNDASGHVFYCRTHNFSFMGVDSTHPVSAKFDVPSGIEKGASKLVVVANGIPSSPVNVTVK